MLREVRMAAEAKEAESVTLELVEKKYVDLKEEPETESASSSTLAPGSKHIIEESPSIREQRDALSTLTPEEWSLLHGAHRNVDGVDQRLIPLHRYLAHLERRPVCTLPKSLKVRKWGEASRRPVSLPPPTERPRIVVPLGELATRLTHHGCGEWGPSPVQQKKGEWP